MINYKLQILNGLLDKYERSAQFRGESVLRSISKSFDQVSFPEYHSGDSPDINLAVKALAQEDVVKITWVKYKTDYLIKRITLNLEQISRAYEVAGRTPKHDTLNFTRMKFEQAQHDIHLEWIQQFLSNCLEDLNVKYKLPQIIRGKEDLLDPLLSSLCGLEDKGDTELPERLFSKKYLGNSKTFELEVRKPLISIAKKYLLEDNPKIQDERVLEALGIEKSSEELSFCGPLVISIRNAITDFSHLPFGVSIDNRTIREFSIKDLRIKKLITIENKAVYKQLLDTKEPDTLLIYLAGFHSPTKRIFLEKLRDYLDSQSTAVEYYHWGDLDYGGIQIFHHLQRKVFTHLKPLHMDIETYHANVSYGEPLRPEAINRLQNLLQNSSYQEFHVVISEMIRHKYWIEQEALVIS